MPNKVHLDTEKTYKAIRQAAEEGRFISYGEIAEASRVSSAKARRLVPTMLGQLATIAHERGWPLLSAIVVTKENLRSGAIEGAALDGFLGAARMVGLPVNDPQAFVSDQQQKVFAWASGAPESLGLKDNPPAATGPRFLRYCPPVLDALRALGDGPLPKRCSLRSKTIWMCRARNSTASTKAGSQSLRTRLPGRNSILLRQGLSTAESVASGP